MKPSCTVARAAGHARPGWRRAPALGLTAALVIGVGCGRLAGKAGGAAASASASASAAPSTSAATAPSAAAPGTRITVARERVGAVRVDRITREIRVPAAPTPGAPARPALELVERIERRNEIRALSEARVGAVAVEYRAAEVTRDGQRAPDPRNGRRFLVSIREGMLTVSDEKEAAVAESLASLVAADHAFLDTPFPLAPFLPDGPLTAGSEVEPSHDAVLALVGGTGDFDVKTLKLAFEGTDGTGAAARARFRLTASFRVTLGDRPLELDLGGQARVEVATGRVTAVEAVGSATTVARGPGEAPARGTARIVLNSTYE
ncbi:MAG TPA: hypothetical protein PLU22_26055 [Polyangiaceae bacterium]|nr:hypothetical protein [Polyangiaceae bacterium]